MNMPPEPPEPPEPKRAAPHRRGRKRSGPIAPSIAQPVAELSHHVKHVFLAHVKVILSQALGGSRKDEQGRGSRAGKKNVAVTAIDSFALLDHDEAIVLHGRNSHRGHQRVEDPGEAVPVERVVDDSVLPITAASKAVSSCWRRQRVFLWVMTGLQLHRTRFPGGGQRQPRTARAAP